MLHSLLVEDEFTSRCLMLELLRPLGTCDVASNAAEAILAVESCIKEQRPYDVIFLDVVLPDGNGGQLLKTIRTFEKEAGIVSTARIIMVTSIDTNAARLAASEWGADGFITKPVEESTFCHVLEKSGISASP